MLGRKMPISKPKVVDMLGVKFSRVSKNSAISLIIDRAKTETARAAYIVKPHVEQVYGALSNPDIKKNLNNAYMALPDGISINWAANYLRKAKINWWTLPTSLLGIVFRSKKLEKIFPNHAWAADFSWQLIDELAKNNLSIYLVGSPKKHDIGQTAKFLQAKFKNLKIAGTFAGKDSKTGKFSKTLEKQLVSKLIKVKPEIIFVALGYPLQEKLCSRLAGVVKNGIFIAEGGTFDYKKFGGHIEQAPKVLSRSGLEWLWRLLREPARIRRQLVIPKFIIKIHKLAALKNEKL